MMAAMLALIFGNAIGADNAEAQPAKPEVTNTQKPSSNSPPKEEAASKNSSESDTSTEEPNCN
jgi:hypothetical protein